MFFLQAMVLYIYNKLGRLATISIATFLPLEEKILPKLLNCNLEGNQNKNNCLVSNFYDKLKYLALFYNLFRKEKGAGNFTLL